MTQTELTYLFNNPSEITETHLEEISEILEAYPYFQAPRAIQLKGLQSTGSFKYNDALKRTAAHTVDRSVLFNFITKFSFDDDTVNAVVLEQIEVIEPETISTEQPTSAKTAIKEEQENNSPEAILEIGKPIRFQKHEPHSFNEWMQLISKKPIRRSDEEALALAKNVANSEPVNKAEQQSLIDRFIKTNPKISPVKKAFELKDISEASSEQNESLMTETLAKVYVEQKKYDNAIQAYRILSLKYPEKSVFFADRIKAIKILQSNKS